MAKTFLKKSVHFQQKSVQSVQFSKKKSVQSEHFIEQIRTFFKKSVQSVQFSKKIPAIRTFKKNKTIFEIIIQHCLTPSATNDVPSNNLYSW